MRDLVDHVRLSFSATFGMWTPDVMRHYFHSDALQAPGLLVGPMVWGISPEFQGSGLGALTYAFRHIATVGRPEGGSGMVPLSILRAFQEAGGSVRVSTKVTTITCEGRGVRGVMLADGTEITAPVVVLILKRAASAPPEME